MDPTDIGMVRQRLERAAMAVLFLVPLVINPWGQSPGGAVKDAVMWAAAGVIGWSFMRWWSASQRIPALPRRLGAPALLWVVVLLASCFSAESPWGSGWAALNAVPFIILAAAVASLARRPGSRRRLMDAWAASAGVASAYAILQHYALPPAVWIDHVAIPRAYGTVGQPTYLAAFLASALPFTLRGRSDVRPDRWRLIAAGLIVVALTATYSRAGWMAALVGLAVTLLAGRGAWAGSRRATGAALAVALVLSLAMAATDPYRADSSQFDRFARLQQGDDTSLTDRVRFVRIAGEAIRLRPLLGWGADGFRAAAPVVSQDWSNRAFPLAWPHANTHNEAFTAALDGGLLGLLAWGAVVLTLASAASDGARREKGARRLAFAAVYGSVAAFVVQGMATPRAPVTTLGLALCWGVAAGMMPADRKATRWSALARRRFGFRRLAAGAAAAGNPSLSAVYDSLGASSGNPKRRQAAALQKGAILAGQVGAVACILLAVCLLAADSISFQGVRAQRAGRLGVAEARFRLAARLYPMEPDHRRLWGETAIARAEAASGVDRAAAARSAAAAFRASVAMEPRNGFWHAGLARALSFQDLPAARREVETAKRLYPQSAHIRYVDAQVCRAEGRPEAERAALHAATENGTTEPEPYIRLAEIFREEGRPELSEKLLVYAAGAWKHRDDLAPWRTRAQARR